MYPLNDNDLDRLSREAAEQYDVDQNTSGWEALENRLNKELPLKEEKERRRFLFWLFFIVLLAGGGVLWTMTGKKTNNDLHLTGTNTIPAVQSNQQNSGAASPVVASNEPNNTNNPTGRVNTTPEAATPAPLAITEKQTPSTSSRQSENKSQSTAESKPTLATANEPDHAPAFNKQPAVNTPGQKSKTVSRKAQGQQYQQQEAQSTGNKKITTGKNKLPTSSANKEGLSKEYDQPLPQEHDPKSSRVSWPGIKAGAIGAIKAPPLTLALSDNPAPTTPKKKKDNSNNKGFEIGLVAGPDMSNVRFTDMDKPGYNVGLQIAYRLSNRWSVNTGLLYTRKNYTVQGKDFTKPNTGWWQSLDLHVVDGYCQMFDIPLNVRYDFAFNNKQRWFASAGASSYIMTSEYYNYDYTYNGVRSQSPRDRDSTSTYLFSILNLSAGFERALNKRFSVQAEPYLKIPMKGLGYGKLNLNSYGIYFSVKYRFNK
jgi:hypothetical protein